MQEYMDVGGRGLWMSGNFFEGPVIVDAVGLISAKMGFISVNKDIFAFIASLTGASGRDGVVLRIYEQVT